MKSDREDHSAAPARAQDPGWRDHGLRGDSSLEEALPVRLIRAVAEGWAEESQAQAARDGCEDPLSGLATLPYLRTRLAEVYRGHGTGPAIALVPARRNLPLRCAGLRRSVLATFGTQIRITPLPGRLTEALRLVDELAR